MSKQEHIELAAVMKEVIVTRAQRIVEDNRFCFGVEKLAKKLCELFDPATVPAKFSLVDGFVIRKDGDKVLLTTACQIEIDEYSIKRDGAKCEDLAREGLFTSSNDERKRVLADGTIAYRPSYETVNDFGRAVVNNELVACAEVMAYIYETFPEKKSDKAGWLVEKAYETFGATNRFPSVATVNEWIEKLYQIVV